MIDSIRRIILQHQLIPSGSRVVVGVSGGADSLALLHILYTLQSSLRFSLHVATLDHGLRGEAGAADAEYVQRVADILGVPVRVGRVDVRQLAADQRIGIEAAARIARYDFLAETAEAIGAERVAVAHHAGDQAETVLMHLVRGTGLAGLGGMRFQSPVPGHPALLLIRPLLGTTRVEIEAYCRAHDLHPREDVTNRDTSLLRNHIRLVLLPQLEQLNPNIQRALGQLADIAQVENAYLHKQVEALISASLAQQIEDRVFIGRTAFRGLHPALQRRLIAWAAEQVNPAMKNLDYQHIVDAVEMGLRGKQGGRALLSDGLQVRIDYENLIVEPQHTPPFVPDQPLLPQNVTIPVQIPGVTVLPDSRWSLHASISPPPADDTFPVARLAIPPESIVTLRTRREGDHFKPLGMAGHSQKVNRWMINRKIPAHLRDRVPILQVDGEIASIFVNSQWFLSHSYAVDNHSGRVIYFRFRYNS